MLQSQFDFVPMIYTHPGMKSVQKRHYLEKMRGKSLDEIYDMILVRITYIMGAKKDMIRLDRLQKR